MKIEIIDRDNMFDLYIDGELHSSRYTKKNLLVWLDCIIEEDEGVPPEPDDEEEIDWSDPEADE